MLAVGGISVALEGESPGSIPAHLQPYLVEEPHPLARCRGRRGPMELPVKARVLFDSGGVWRVDQAASGIRLVLRAGEHPGRPYHLLELDEDLTRGEARLDPRGLQDRQRPFLLRDPLHELWVCFLLMRGRGLLVHGCGLLQEDGMVRVFLGQSGAGKSTLAALLQEHACGEILSDDRLIIRPDGQGFAVWGTPWHGEARFASPSMGVLAAIRFLEKAPESRLIELGPKEAVTRLFQACFLAGWPRTGLDFVLRFGVEVATQVDCRVLRFRPDRTAVAAAVE